MRYESRPDINQHSSNPRAKRIQNQIVQFGKTRSEYVLQRLDQQGKQKTRNSGTKECSLLSHILQVHAKWYKPDNISDKQIGKCKPVPPPDQVNIALKKCQDYLSVLT